MIWRNDIEGLRGVAIIFVIFYHFFPLAFPGGFTGVDIFFVISGYLITSIILNEVKFNTFNYKIFYFNRIVRLFPSLILSVLASYIIGYFFLLNDEFEQLRQYIISGLTFTTNILAINDNDYFSNAIETKPLMHLWSLSIEEQFYILWPIILVSIYSKIRKYFKIKLIILIILIILISFTLYVIEARVSPVLAFYSPQNRIWELMFGALAIFIPINNRFKGKSIYKKSIPSAIGTLLILHSLFFISNNAFYSGWAILCPVFGALLIIIPGRQAWLNKKIYSSMILRFFGKISYPLYLWHWILLSFAKIALEESKLSLFVSAILILISIILGYGSFKFLEQPLKSVNKQKASYLLIFGVIPCLTITIIFPHPIHESIAKYLNHSKKQTLKENNILINENILTPEDKLINTIFLDQKKLDLYKFKLNSDKDYIKNQHIELEKIVRSPTCHMRRDTNKDFSAHKNEMGPCMAIANDRKNILIIGDSFAASLYASLSSSYKDYNFLQATGAACTPSGMRTEEINLYPEHVDKCNELINFAIDFAIRNKESLSGVILAGRWSFNYRNIDPFIKKLKLNDVNFILVGPGFEYMLPVNTFLARSSKTQSIPDLSMKFINIEPFEINRAMAAYARDNNIAYLDRINTYCTLVDKNYNCPLLNDNGDLLILDVGHPTRDGAIYFGKSLSKMRILEKHF